MPLIYKVLQIKWKKTLKKTENIFLIPKKVLSLEGGKQTTTLRQTIMEFTIENQKGNKITWTTSQKVKHNLYSNNEVSISGMGGVHTVWHKQGSRISQKAWGLNLLDAIDFANKYIKNI